jgi:hypothetical protein
MSTYDHTHTGFTPQSEAATDGVVDAESTSVRQQRFRRTRYPKASGTDATKEATSALLAEVMLLREENAWLKAAQHQTPGIGEAIERVRALPGERTGADDREDEATQVLAEAYVLRESLIELCDEMQRAIVTVRTRLGELNFTELDDGPKFEDDGQRGASVIQIDGGQVEVSSQ